MANSGLYEEDYDSDSLLGVDSDVESNFSVTESPADGYFADRAHPQETFVENSSVSAEAQAKARERAQERRTSRSTASPPTPLQTTSSTGTQAASAQWANAETSVENDEDAPPDYESATATSSQPLFNAQAQHIQNYHSRSQDSDSSIARTSSNIRQYGTQPSSTATNAPFAARSSLVNAHVVTLGRALGLAQEHSPSQSMRDAGVDEESGLLTRVKSKRKQKRWTTGCCSCQSMCNFVIFAVVVLLIIIIASVADDRSEAGSPGTDIPSTPIISPPSIMPPTPERCHYGPYTDGWYDFGRPENFSLVELIDDWVSDDIYGRITIRPAQGEQSSDIRVGVGYSTTSQWEVVRPDTSWADDSFTIRLPEMKKLYGDSSRKPCLFVDVRIDIRPGSVLTDWEISTGHFDVIVEDGLFNLAKGEEHLGALQVLGSSSFNTVRGSSVIHYWSSRETIIDTISGSIRGTLALLDVLSVHSASGTISINVDPKEASRSEPKPADFSVKSTSGTVKVYFPMEGDIPERQYQTRVETTSASIHGEFLLGAFNSFNSNSGTIDAELLPVFDPKQPNTLRSNTGSSSTKLQILQALGRKGEAWSKAHSIHKFTSTSGSLTAVYPHEWSGTVDARSISGSISVQGKDVDHLLDEKLPGYHHVLARKGLEKSGDTQLKSTSGSIRVHVGEV